MNPSRKSSSGTVVLPKSTNSFKINTDIDSIDDVTTVASNPTLFKKLRNKLHRHDTSFDEELQKHGKKPTRSPRTWLAALLMIIMGILIAVTFILVGLGKSLSNNHATIETNSTTTATVTITTTLLPTATSI